MMNHEHACDLDRMRCIRLAKDTGAVLRDHIADLTKMRGYAAEELTDAKHEAARLKREIRSIDREIEDARRTLAAWKRDPESAWAEEFEYRPVA